jgi:D-arabinose 1-dehydrogenase-like Zn-dependent alcohol dehydrogenase
MKAVAFEQFGQPLKVIDVADPIPLPDGVVVQVESTGLCRSDWHAWQGHDPDIKQLPHVPGHELAGTIVAVGAQVKRWHEGDRVTVPFAAGCGSCPSCGLGDTHVCDHQYQPGFSGWGSFAEYVALRYADLNLIRIPEAMSSSAAASLGCRFSTAYRAVIQQARLTSGEWLAVFGCGGVGLSAIMIANAFGIRTIAMDINDRSLELAKLHGAEHILNAKAIDKIPEAIMDLTSGGAHASLDAIGNAKVVMDSIMSLRKRGRHVQVGLMTGRDIITRIPIARVIAWELELLGSHGLPVSGFAELIELTNIGRLNPESLIERTINLDQLPDAIAAMSNFQDHGITMVEV